MGKEASGTEVEQVKVWVPRSVWPLSLVGNLPSYLSAASQAIANSDGETTMHDFEEGSSKQGRSTNVDAGPSAWKHRLEKSSKKSSGLNSRTMVMKRTYRSTTSDEELSEKRARRDTPEGNPVAGTEMALSAVEGRNLAVQWLGLLDLTMPEPEIAQAPEGSRNVKIIDLTNEKEGVKRK
jgi:hypothetical protein